MSTIATTPTTHEIAARFHALAQQEKWFEIQDECFADDVRSVEPAGPETCGKKAAHEKGEAWARANDIHSSGVEGPYVHGDRFVVRFTIDLTQRDTGQRMQLDEVGLYTLKNGKIVEERFFYAG